MTVDERRVTTALQAYALGLDVTDPDLEELEARLHERLHPAPHPDTRRGAWEWVVAACAVVALVLAATALWRTRVEEETMPAAPTVTPADLAGTWLVDSENDKWLWHFSADGHLVFSSTPRAYVDHDDHTVFTLEGDVISFPDRGGQCRATVRQSADGRMAVSPREDLSTCAMWAEGPAWLFVRVSPASLAGATHPGRHLALQRAATDVDSMGDITGTWLLEGSGTILVVRRTDTGVGEYVIDDDGDGFVEPDQRGTVTLQRDGGVVLHPVGGPEQGCDTVYSRVVTTGSALEAELADVSCGGLGAARDWIRLN